VLVARPVLSFAKSFPAALVAVAFALLLLVPAARSDSAGVSWTAPTPVDQTKYSVSPGKLVSFALSAATVEPGASLVITPAQPLPSGVRFNASGGGLTAQAKFSWNPEKAGDYAIRFTAIATTSTGATTAPMLTYFVHVKGIVVHYPMTAKLTNEKSAHWAQVLKKAVVRTQPKASARAVTKLETITTDGTHNIVLVLNEMDISASKTWYRIRLPILPNNSTGWVQADALGALFQVNTHLYVDRAHFRATLKKNGKVIFTTIVGVGRSIWPTPTGQFYIRDKLTSFNDPFYGPVAFGTSARSATLTDWPGGGFVGVHGTNEPGILPGRVSHGCIRMPNSSILKLARLMPVGTPLTIT
jgi:hypothetical protein